MARRRGFAAMDEEAQRKIASKGGRAAHARGTAHKFDAQEAEKAGRKGGLAVSRDRQHMAEIGRKGGLAAHNREVKGTPGSTEQENLVLTPLHVNGSPEQADNQGPTSSEGDEELGEAGHTIEPDPTPPQ